jgi:hypothetical protein
MEHYTNIHKEKFNEDPFFGNKAGNCCHFLYTQPLFNATHGSKATQKIPL